MCLRHIQFLDCSIENMKIGWLFLANKVIVMEEQVSFYKRKLSIIFTQLSLQLTWRSWSLRRWSAGPRSVTFWIQSWSARCSAYWGGSMTALGSCSGPWGRLTPSVLPRSRTPSTSWPPSVRSDLCYLFVWGKRRRSSWLMDLGRLWLHQRSSTCVKYV